MSLRDKPTLRRGDKSDSPLGTNTPGSYVDARVSRRRRWTGSMHAGTGKAPSAEATEGEPPFAEASEGKPLMDRMMVTPVEPLEANQDWRLEIAAGLKSVSGNGEVRLLELTA